MIWQSLLGFCAFLAIAWVLSNPAVTGAIVGARSAQQAEGVMRAAEVRLSAEDIAKIEEDISR